MLPLIQNSFKNGLIKVLSPEDFSRLQPGLEAVDLGLKYSLVTPNQETEHVYFIERGLASIVAESSDGAKIEVGHIGWEGMSGRSVALGVNRSPNHTFMQIPGKGWRVRAADFAALEEESSSFRHLMLRYVQSVETQVEHSALAAGRYAIPARLARWLLMCHDRTEGDDLLLTHEFLSFMLGVRRSGVTVQIHILEGEHLIKATRRNVRVLNREGLVKRAGGCYGVPEEEYRRLISNYQYGNGSSILQLPC